MAKENGERVVHCLWYDDDGHEMATRIIAEKAKTFTSSATAGILQAKLKSLAYYLLTFLFS